MMPSPVSLDGLQFWQRNEAQLALLAGIALTGLLVAWRARPSRRRGEVAWHCRPC
jgi:hypothetical protein